MVKPSLQALKAIAAKRPLLTGSIGAAAIIAGLLLVFPIWGTDAPALSTATVERGDLSVTIAASGKVKPADYVDVGAQVSGQLKRFLVDVGDKVARGDLLAEIDPRIAQSKVDQGRAQLRELEAALDQQEASVELAQANAARATLLRSSDAISIAEYQAAIAEQKIAAGRLTELKAQIERQQSTLDADLANLEYTKIYAPITGTVVSQSAVEGQTLNANQTTPTILRIADLSQMTVEADVSEADVLRIKAGQEATFTLLGSERTWTAAVRQVLPQPEIVNDVVLYKALLDVPNEDGALRPEMTAQVFFIEGAAKDALLVPVAALRSPRERSADTEDSARATGETVAARPSLCAAMTPAPDATCRVVLVLVDGTPRPKAVMVGLRGRSQAVILEGLSEGDIVVLRNAAAANGNRPTQNFGQTPPGVRGLTRR
ncbi:MAG: efflux RND transporter periplasmic adaptor subunit [Alphaproteobacteria bacterium]|nr:efflux RND transporter periplasmic adaptor subunit [Alphaproteobacteria bacterium]